MIYYFLIFFSFIMAISNYVVNISVPLFLTENLKATRFEIGLAGFSGNFGYTFMTLLISRYIRKKLFLFVYSPVLIGIAYILFPHTPLYPVFFLMFLIGILYARYWPSIQNCFRNAPERFIGNFNLSWSSGIIVGSFLSGFIYSKGKLLPFIISGSMCIFTGLLLFFLKNNIYSLDIKQKEKKGSGFRKFNIKEIRILNFMNFFSIGIMLFIFPRYAIELKYPPSFISQIISVILITRFLGFGILKKKSFISSKYILLISTFFFFISYFLLSQFNSPFYFIISFIIIGILSAILYHNSLVAHLQGGYRTEIHEGVVGSGFLSGSLIAGFLSQILNFKIAFLLIGIFFLLFGVFYTFKKK